MNKLNFYKIKELLFHSINIVFLIMIGILISSCSKSNVPVIQIPENNQTEVTIKELRIIGPFIFQNSLTSIPAQIINSKTALIPYGHSYNFLETFGLDEKLVKPKDLDKITCTERKDFVNQNYNINSVPYFNINNLFKIKDPATVYFMCEVENKEEGIQTLIFSGGTVKLWLNHNLILDRSDYRRTIKKYQDFIPAHFKKGKNIVFGKFTRSKDDNKEWCMVFRITNNEIARKLQLENQDIDLLKDKIVSLKDTLLIKKGLHLLSDNHIAIEIVDANNIIKKSLLVSDFLFDERRIVMDSLQDGAYTCRINHPNYKYEEPFYYGDIFSKIEKYKKLSLKYKNNIEAFNNINALFIRLDHLLTENSRNIDQKFWHKVWQYKVVTIMHLLEKTFLRLEKMSNPFYNFTGLQIRSFVSEIDKQNYQYMFYVPKKVNQSKPNPLVIIYPDAIKVERPFLKSGRIAFIESVQTYCRLAEEYGYIMLWQSPRGATGGAPIGITDFFETVTQVKKYYNVDEDRIYLFSNSAGCVGEIVLTCKFPSLIAAIGLVTPAKLEWNTQYLGFTKPGGIKQTGNNWADINNTYKLIKNIKHVPIKIVHAEKDKGHPIEAVTEFVNRCNIEGIYPEFELLKDADEDYFPENPWKKIFEFFKDKHRVIKPNDIEFSTAQLKYNQSYWIKINELTEPMTLGTIKAVIDSNNHINVNTKNINSYEILLDKLNYRHLSPIKITNNGIACYNDLSKNNTIKIYINKSQKDETGLLQKNHEIEGPLMDAFAHPFIIVEGTKGSESEKKSTQQYAKDLADSWQEYYFVPCVTKKDVEIKEDDIKNNNLILVGTENSNVFLKKVLKNIPLKINKEAVNLCGNNFAGNKIGINMIYPNPFNQNKYVVILSSNHSDELRLKKRRLFLDGWYDFVLWSGDEKLISVGYFNNKWNELIFKEPIYDQVFWNDGTYTEQ